MSFSSNVKQEVSQKIMEGNDARAELSALIQMTSSLSFSNRGMTILVMVENAAVARTIYRMIKERYNSEIELFVKKKMNLKKNRIYGLRILSGAPVILTELGIYSARGLLEKPLQKIVSADNSARAYLAGAFLASGSINPPEKTDYHLEITAANETHAYFVQEVMNRFYLNARVIERRNRFIVYIKAAEKIADFLRIIEAEQALFEFENIRIERDLANNIQRLNNIDVANEMKAQSAALKQLEDIHVVENSIKYATLDKKLKDVIEIRKENPESSLNELCEYLEEKTGKSVSKSGLRHRFVKIHEMAEDIRERESEKQ